MFYVLFVFKTGATLMLQTDDLSRSADLMAEHATNDVSYVQRGILMAGPVFDSIVLADGGVPLDVAAQREVEGRP